MGLRIADWLIYAGAVAALTVAALTTRENAEAPPAPPPPPGGDALVLGPSMPFDPATLADATPRLGAPQLGTAFVVSGTGAWLTARSALGTCRAIGVAVSSGEAVRARVVGSGPGDLAALRTEGAPTALPIAASGPMEPGRVGFIAGFPRGAPGEIAVRLIGPERLRWRGRAGPGAPVLAWAEIGRTDGLKGGLKGLEGAPVMDGAGRVMGVALAESPRRGRIFTTDPASLTIAARRLNSSQDAPAGLPVTLDNYGPSADALRRDLRIARLTCLDR